MNAARTSGIGIMIGAKDANGVMRRFFANEAVADILGYSVEELLTQTALFNVAPASVGAIRGLIERRKKGEQEPEAFELPCLRKDGTTVNLQAAFSDAVI